MLPEEATPQNEPVEPVNEPTEPVSAKADESPAVEAQPEESPIDRGIREANEREGVVEPKAEKVEAKPNDKPVEAKAGEEDDEDERDEEIEKEIVERKLTEKSADRFRELAGKAKQRDEAMTRAEAAETRADAAEKERDEWHNVVASTGATPQQFGQVLGVLAFMNSDEPVKLRQAHAALEDALSTVARKLGMEATGYDPLDEHPQLKQAVENGDMDRKHALEVAAARKSEALITQRSTQQAQEQQVQHAKVQAAQQVTELGNQLAASDPHYQAKLPILMPLLHSIRETTPPDQWAARVREVYASIPNPAPTPARAPIGTLPTRGASVSSAAVSPKITSANAFDIGLQEANRRGYGGL